MRLSFKWQPVREKSSSAWKRNFIFYRIDADMETYTRSKHCTAAVLMIRVEPIALIAILYVFLQLRSNSEMSLSRQLPCGRIIATQNLLAFMCSSARVCVCACEGTKRVKERVSNVCCVWTPRPVRCVGTDECLIEKWECCLINLAYWCRTKDNLKDYYFWLLWERRENETFN